MNRSSQFALVVFLFSAFQLILTNSVRAQGGATGAISGQVVDSSGSSVADADVQIINTAIGTVVRKLPTGVDGTFVAPLLPPGNYSVVVNKSGFSQSKADGVEVRVTETTKVTILLKPGAVSERVEIVAFCGNRRCRLDVKQRRGGLYWRQRRR